MKRNGFLLAASACGLLSVGLMAGCDSQASLTANPGSTLNTTPVLAKVQTAATGTSLLFDTTTMPQELRDAKSLKVVFGTTAMPLTQVSATGSTAVVPPTTMLDPDTQGKQNFVFVLDRAKSQVVEVQLTR